MPRLNTYWFVTQVQVERSYSIEATSLKKAEAKLWAKDEDYDVEDEDIEGTEKIISVSDDREKKQL